jgi:hypothetical protein
MADPEMCELVKSFNAANRIAAPGEIAGIVLFLIEITMLFSRKTAHIVMNLRECRIQGGVTV